MEGETHTDTWWRGGWRLWRSSISEHLTWWSSWDTLPRLGPTRSASHRLGQQQCVFPPFRLFFFFLLFFPVYFSTILNSVRWLPGRTNTPPDSPLTGRESNQSALGAVSWSLWHPIRERADERESERERDRGFTGDVAVGGALRFDWQPETSRANVKKRRCVIRIFRHGHLNTNTDTKLLLICFMCHWSSSSSDSSSLLFCFLK